MEFTYDYGDSLEKVTKLQKARILRGFTQVELAEQTGINLRSLQYYEQGCKDIEHVRLDKLLKLCLVLKCDLKDIVEDSNCRTLVNEYNKMEKEAII